MFLYLWMLISICMRITNALSLSLIKPSLLAANGISNTTESFLVGAFKPICNIASETWGLNVASCEEAVNLVKKAYTDSDGARTIYRRNIPKPKGADQSVPSRTLSCRSIFFSEGRRQSCRQRMYDLTLASGWTLCC